MAKLLQGIDTIILRVKNIESSKQWYSEKLGLVPEWEDAILNLAVMNTGGPTSLTLWQTAEPVVSSKEGSAYPIFRTPDAEMARTSLLEKNVSADPIVTDHVVTYFRFYDPDGNIMEACQVH